MKWNLNAASLALSIGMVAGCTGDVPAEDNNAAPTPSPITQPITEQLRTETVADQLLLAQQLSFMSPYSLQGYLALQLFYPAPSSDFVAFFGPACETSGSIDYLSADLDGDTLFVSSNEYSQMNFVECNNTSDTTGYTNHTNGNIIRTVISSREATVTDGNKVKLSDAGFFSEQVEWQGYSQSEVEGTESFQALDGKITTQAEWRRSEDNWRRLQAELASNETFLYSTDALREVTFSASRIVADTVHDDTQYAPIHRSIEIAGTHSKLGPMNVQMSNWQIPVIGDPELIGSAEVRLNTTVVRVSNLPASTEPGLPKTPYLHMLFDDDNDGQVDRSVFTNQFGQEVPELFLNP